MNTTKIDLNLMGTTYSVASPNIYENYKNTGDVELFEKLVTDLILNKYSDDLETNEYILSLPKRDQRMAILSLVDKDTRGDSNLLWSEMKAYVDSNRNNKIDHIKDIIKIINRFVKDGEVEKKKFGEVMTPISLVREMLNTLPKEVWSNPNLKWLDPANGAGTFPFVVICNLMNGLKKWEEDPEKRYKHIVENMIYTCELQSRNVFLWMCGVDPYDEYVTNSYWGSFLDDGFDYHMKNVWGVEKFDIIIGNPPYNTSGGTATGNTIWNLFVEKSEYITNRFVVYIHPCSWRMPLREGDRFYNSSKFIRNAKYINIIDEKKSKEYFGLSIKVDYYLIDLKYSGTCEIVNGDYKTNIDIKKIPLIPSFDLEGFSKLIDNDNKCDVIFSYSYDPRNKFISKVKDSNHIYTLVHTTPKSGNRYVYSSLNNRGHFNIPKVIFGDSGIYDVIIDINGEYGMTQHSIGLKINSLEEGQKLKYALMSDKFKDFLNSVSFSNYQIDWRIFTHLNKDFFKFFI
jgi:hypothetical protein